MRSPLLPPLNTSLRQPLLGADERFVAGAGLAAAAFSLLALVAALALAGAPALASGLLTGAGLLGLGAAAWTRLRRRARQTGEADRFDALVESIGDAVVRYDASGAVVFVSRSAETLFGCRRYALDASGLLERIHVMDRPLYLKTLSDARAAGRAGEAEIRMRRDGPSADTVHLWIEIAFSPEGAGAVVAVLRDVGARRRAREELDEARRQAEAASESKSRFLATIGHELRTPLNAIVGFSDMMRAGIGGTLTPGHYEYAGLIKQSGHHLLEVVNMLLDMARIEAGKFELHTEPFAPETLAAPCLQLVEAQARERGVTVLARLPAALPALVGDERACRQILINLLANAVKFSTPGGTVTLSMKRQGKMLNLSVADTGIGMAPETVRRIGEPFFQAQEGLDRRYEGTGLGLSIVKGLVTLHEGQLHVLSESGVGTTMTVLLPLDGPARKDGAAGAPAPLLRNEKEPRRDPWPEKATERERRSAAR